MEVLIKDKILFHIPISLAVSPLDSSPPWVKFSTTENEIASQQPCKFCYINHMEDVLHTSETMLETCLEIK